MKNKDRALSLVRTIVPVIVGWLVSQAARVGWDIPPEALSMLLEPVIISLYYTAVRLLEDEIPSAGWLLGLPKPPHY